MPVAAMSYLTAPFVKRVAMEIPETARRSRDALMNFTRNMPGTTRLEFTTLRAYPFERNTGMVLSELRALPPQKGRFANIELPKTKEWRQNQKKKAIYMRFWEVLAEPRFKFYVKEGRSYTVKTGVPGVWENVAMAIQQRTLKEAADKVAAAAKMNVKAACETCHTCDAGQDDSVYGSEAQEADFTTATEIEHSCLQSHWNNRLNS
jgi:hypothetical protein